MSLNYKLYTVPEITSLQDMIIQSARKYGDKLALEDLTDTKISKVTFGELLDLILRFGTSLRKLEIPERTHIAVISENRVQWGLTYLTAAAFNYVIVPIDKNLSTNEILNIVHESDAEVIVHSEAFSELFMGSRSTLKRIRHYINMDLDEEREGTHSMTGMMSAAQPGSVSLLPKIKPEELFEIIFTSGSLGRAKGVMLSQGNIAENLMGMTAMIYIGPDDKFLSVLPVHHTYECTCGFLCPLYTGASVSYARSLKTVVEDLVRVKATVLLAVPLLYDKMFKRIYKAIQDDKVKSKIVPPLVKLSNAFEIVGWKSFKKKIFAEIHHKFGGSIRIFIAGGAAPDPKVAKGLREFGFTFVQGYGLTETSPISALNRLDMFKDDAAGLPLPRTEIKINNPDSDGIGEIYIRGKHVMLGYYKNESLTRESIVEGWFRTGDLGSFDKEGFLHINGRKKNVIIANNGKNVFPEEVEDVLNRSSFVKESLVYGERDTKHQEVIAVKIVIDGEAFIELAERQKVKITEELINSTISEVIKETNKQLASFKQIKKFYIRENEFEKTTTQKIKRYLVNN